MLLLLGVLSHAGAVTYHVLQDANALRSGDSILIAVASQNYVMGVYASGNNIPQVAAVKDADSHTITAPDANCYIVEISDNGIAFKDQSGRYLSNTSTSTKNKMQAVATADASCYWNISITNEVASIVNKGNSNRPNMLYNKSASCFACYAAADNTTFLPLTLYSNHASSYTEPVLNPAIVLKLGSTILGDTLDWGEVVYDDSWGTEAAPYSELKTITIQTTDLSDAVSASLQTGSAFTLVSSSVPATGGSLSVNFEVTAPGTYTDVLTITSGAITKTVVLRAKAVRQASVDPSTKPTITTSTVRVYLNSYFYSETGLEEMDIFYVSAKNLTKALYCKWENTEGYSIPTGGKGTMTVTLEGYGDLVYGSSLNLGTDDIDSLEVTVYVNAYCEGMYTSQLHFYTYADKTTIAAERRVDLVVNMTTLQTPDPDPNHDPNPATGLYDATITIDGKIIRNGRVLIRHDGMTFDLNGRRVE